MQPRREVVRREFNSTSFSIGGASVAGATQTRPWRSHLFCTGGNGFSSPNALFEYTR